MVFGKEMTKQLAVVFAMTSCIAAALIFDLTPTAMAAEEPFSYQYYADILRAYVDDQGMVDYAALKQNRGPLDAFVTRIANLESGVYDKWSEKEKIAFWINAYNALTLRAIIDHYPIKASLLRSVRFPKNSIRQIPGVWDKLQFKVMGREITLDGIEHDTLRANFNEPRIHMALVCAAMGCPPLRNEPFIAGKLDMQLDDQARRFFNDPQKFSIDRKTNTIHLSPIFKWFGEDFVNKYGTEKAFSGFSEQERAVLNFITHYSEDGGNAYLMKGGFSQEYLNYDWSLNERKG
jgi:hypothetical protein